MRKYERGALQRRPQGQLRLAMGEIAFRDALIEGLDILSNSTGIISQAGWLYDFIRKNAAI